MPRLGASSLCRGLLHLAAQLTIWSVGGWWWTSHSPTGSGPEGSSPNEPGTGHRASLPPFRPSHMWQCPSLTGPGRGANIPFEWPSGHREGGTRIMDETTGTTIVSTGPTPESQAPYRVLARKYRPKDFTDLIGQEPMVRTLTNAFSSGRIAQAWMLTGVRGVGKTTTARILARALNYETAEIAQPTIDLTVPGEHCQAIMEGRHVDVIEMDAASHTGIDDIREIIEQVRYRPVSARYKVYIIDEVHMLSNHVGRAAGPCEIHLCHHRNPQGSDHGAVALPAF